MNRFRSARFPALCGAVLGIYDDVERTTTMGKSPFWVIKSVYLGIDFGQPESGQSSIEFSIAGMRSDIDAIIVTAITWSPAPAVTIGPHIQSPADTTAASTGTGGVVVAWSGCLPGGRTLARIDFLLLTPLVNKVLQVKRRYPTTNPNWRTPVFLRCDGPPSTTERMRGGCYILNWSGHPDVLACLDEPVAVEPRTWTGVKSLFR